MHTREIHDESSRTLRSAEYCFGGGVKPFLPLLLFALALLSACGGSGSGTSTQSPGTAYAAGNWQFTLAAPSDNSFQGGVQGGFLLQTAGALIGGATYAVSLPAQQGGVPTLCSSGSGPVTGSISGQGITLTVVAGVQTFNLTGTLSADGSTRAAERLRRI